MTHVVFLRGANVGGNNVFRPAQFARALKHLDLVNVGAAGTFIVRAPSSTAEIKRELAKKLPFACEIMVRPAREIRALVNDKPFDGVEFTKDLRGWVGVLGAKPKISPTLPFIVAPGGEWALRMDRVDGHFAYGLWRRTNKMTIPANQVEKVLGVPVTVRWWETYERICNAMD